MKADLNITNESGTDLGISDEILFRALELTMAEIDKPSAGLVELTFIDDDTMTRLNKKHRGKDGVTDVLSFPYDEGGVLGEIFIAPNYALEQKRNLIHLFIHGLLHLYGFEHETDEKAEEMEGIEKKILSPCHSELDSESEIL